MNQDLRILRGHTDPLDVSLTHQAMKTRLNLEFRAARTYSTRGA